MLKFLFKKTDGLPAAAPVPAPAPSPVVRPAPVAAVAPVAEVRHLDGAPAAPVSTDGMKVGANGFRSDHKSLYRQLLRGLYDAVLITDPKGHVIDGNDRVAEYFQFGKNEVWDMEITKLIPGLSRPLLDRVRQGLSEDRYVMIDARCLRKDGTIFPAEVSICTISLMNEGDFVFAVRNVEKRKRQLRFYRSLQNAVDNDLAAVAVCDPAGVVTYANPRFMALWGVEKSGAILGKPLADQFAGSTALLEEACAKVRAGERWQGVLHATGAGGVRLSLAAAFSRDVSGDADSGGMICSLIETKEG